MKLTKTYQQNSEKFIQLWTPLKAFFIVINCKDLGQRFTHYPERREVVFFPLEQISINWEIYNTLRSYEFWNDRYQDRLLYIENSFPDVLKISAESVQTIFQDISSSSELIYFVVILSNWFYELYGKGNIQLTDDGSIIEEIIKLDGPKCQVIGNVQVVQIYKDMWHYLQKRDDKLPNVVNVKNFMDVLSQIENSLIKNHNENIEVTSLTVDTILSMIIFTLASMQL